MVVVPIIGTMKIDLSPIEIHNLSGHCRAKSTTDCHNSNRSPSDRGVIERARDGPDAAHEPPRGGGTNPERGSGPVSGGGGTQGPPGPVRKGPSQGLSGAETVLHRSTIREWLRPSQWMLEVG